ncbi:MAG: hypothetical protein K5867_07690 [Bacteroidales bacterium]|nr:hypothetical protein [Bacteroidales bacterium]
METLELLSEIAVKGEDILPETDNLWLRKENDYRRFDRTVDGEEIRKAVGIVFGFVILVVDSSNHPFYRRILSERLTTIVANHKWNDWTTTLERIFDLTLPDGWFDAFIDDGPDGNEIMTDLSERINTLQSQPPTTNLTIQFVKEQYNTNCQQFMGKMENPQFITPKRNEAV